MPRSKRGQYCEPFDTQQIRTHVESELRRATADVNTETLRKGSPHSLIAVKNQASYKRRVAQRKQDFADLVVLNG